MQDFLELDEMEFENDFEYADEFEYSDEYSDEMSNETDDETLAYELLAAESDQELDQFLGGLVRRAAAGARRFISSPQGKQIGSDFRDGIKAFGRKMIPSLGRNTGGYFGERYGGPKGGQYGSRAGHNVGKWALDRLGWDEEMMTPDQMELEVAKKVVQVAKTAANAAVNAAQAKKGNPRAIVHAAINSAARRVLNSPSGKKSSGSRQSGRWVRRGSKIVILGA
jgi:hypothetical protein